MLKLRYIKFDLVFKQPAGTSRGVLRTKPSWFLILQDLNIPGEYAIGECGILPGLSCDDRVGYEEKIIEVVEYINSHQTLLHNIDLCDWPSIRFGFEILHRDFLSKRNKILFDSDFTNGNYNIPINGLIWMGDKKSMFDQIKYKIDTGWSCIKMKIGAIDFEAEISLLKYIRNQFNSNDLELRVDANGAFSLENALERLKVLSELELHSIEQPIKQGKSEEMAELCRVSPLPIALDEELIGVNNVEDKVKLLTTIQPQYIILKPSLVGGWKASEEWIKSAKDLGIKFWATSALESNIGLNAIAQWTATLDKEIIHGLGTGQLYTNNIDSPLMAEQGYLSYRNTVKWDLHFLKL